MGEEPGRKWWLEYLEEMVRFQDWRAENVLMSIGNSRTLKDEAVT